MTRLRELRKERKLTQRQVAERMRVTVPAICHWELGYRKPTIDVVAAYCKAIGATIMIGLEEDSQP